jgi:tetratricopeptide (TPR) repeat protein
MKRLLTTLVILTGLIGSAGAVWADAQRDFLKGVLANEDGNFEEAVKWYRKAAEQGVAKAQFNLGWMYDNGEGFLPEDKVKAAKWYRKAVEQGSGNSAFNLGMMYETGEGVTQDYAEALKWFRKAEELSNQPMMGEAVKNLEAKIAAVRAQREEKERHAAEARRREEQRIAATKRKEQERRDQMRSDLVSQGIDQCLFDEIEKVTGPETERIVKRYCHQKFKKRSLDWLERNVD